MPELIPAAPGSPELAARVVGEPFPGEHANVVAGDGESRPPVKLSPWSRTGMIHGAYDAARPVRKRLGFRPVFVESWQYRRGYARTFLLAREAARHG